MDLYKIPYKYFFWGPLLFQVKMLPQDLKKCISLCSKKSSKVNDTLAGVIKHEHYISPTKYIKILDPYLVAFRESYKKFYGVALTQNMQMSASWVNFMVAGEFNPPHIHLNCDFSSVLFTQIPSQLKEEHKAFQGKGHGGGAISFTYGELNKGSLTSRDFFPEEGDFFMFPSSLKHFVAPFISKGERISMSANFKLE